MKTLDRSLSAEERALLGSLVAAESVPPEIRAQADHVRVTSSCECGCGSIYFDVDHTKATAGRILGGRRVLVAADIIGSQPDQVVLIVTEGWIEGIDILWYTDPVPLPRADEISAPRVNLR